jgi:hypothetical protein
LIFAVAVALLDLPFQLLALSVDHGEVVIRELAPLLLDLAGELLSVTFDAIPIHLCLLWAGEFISRDVLLLSILRPCLMPCES